MNKINKVKFLDNHILDDYILENSVLSSKLQSKVDALSIMSKELDKCSMERDRYKNLVEQLDNKKSTKEDNNINCMYKYAPTNTISGGEILAKAKEHNNILKLEVEKLKSKLEEADGDIMALRMQLRKSANDVPNETSSNTHLKFDHEQLVQDLEKIQKKYRQIQMDYRATLDEKEELVLDRDYYKNKVQKLNQQISFLLTNNVKNLGDGDVNKPIVDIDVLVTENKYLNERVAQLQIEKEILKRNFNKLKSILENRKKSSAKDNKGFVDVMTRKQVCEYLNSNFKSGLKKNSASEMKSICLGLIDALHDKSISLQHQKKTNQILANRITDLEKTMESWCKSQNCVPIFPSQMLLDEILADSSVRCDENKDKHDNEQPDTNKDNYIDSDDEKPCDSFCVDGADKNISKIVLPDELQQLVVEALKEIKSVY